MSVVMQVALSVRVRVFFVPMHLAVFMRMPVLRIGLTMRTGVFVEDQ